MKRLYVGLIAAAVLTCNQYITLRADDDDFIDSALSSELYPTEATNVVNLTPNEILGLLAEFHINRIVESGFYRYTYNPQTRNVLDIPLITPFCPHQSECKFNIFYNQTNRVYLTKNSSCIDSYLTLSEHSDFLDDLDQLISTQTNLNVPQLIGYFKEAYVEERRAGGLLQWWYRWNNFVFGAQMPLMYQERNFNLPQETVEKITHTLGGNDTPSNTQKAYQQHVVFDKVGIGDLRLTASWHPLETDLARLCTGFDCTVPTDTAFATGLIGSNLDKAYEPVIPNLTAIISEAVGGDSTDSIQGAMGLGFDVIDQLGAILLNNSLGYNRQWSLGWFIQPEYSPRPRINIVTRGRIACIFGKNVCRYFNQVKNPADFTDEAFSPDLPESQAAQQLEFLQTQLRYNYFPYRAHTHLKSRIMVEGTIMPRLSFTDNWELILGYDYWYLSADRLVMNTTVPGIQYPLNPCSAQRPSAWQQRLFGNLQYTAYHPYHDILFTLGADAVPGHSGIGADWSIVLGFAITY